MATFTTDKKYLDQDGLRALILKIAQLNKKIQNQQGATAGDLAGVQAAVAALQAWKTNVGSVTLASGKYTAADGMLKQLADETANLKTNIIGTPTAGKTIVQMINDINTDVQAMTGDLGAAGAALGNVSVDQTNPKQITLSFSLLDSSKPAKTCTINTSDFLVHGILSGADSFVVPRTAPTADLTTDNGIVIPTAKLNGLYQAAPGAHYLVFQFDMAHSDNAGSGAHTGEFSQVYVNVDQLFEDFRTENATLTGDTAKYVSALTLTKTTAPDATTKYKVVPSITLTQNALDAFSYVLGTKTKTGDTKYPAYNVLSDSVDALKTSTNAEATKVTALETWKTTVTTTLTSIQNDLTAIKDWITAHTIPTSYVTNLFDYHVFSTTGQAAITAPDIDAISTTLTTEPTL